MYCSFSRSLRRVLKLCREEQDAATLSDGCAAAITKILEHGLDDVLGESPSCPCNYSSHKWMKCRVDVYVKVCYYPLMVRPSSDIKFLIGPA